MNARRVIDRVQAVALGKPVIERPGLGTTDWAGRPIAYAQLGRSSTSIGAAAAILERAVGGGADVHRRAEVRQEIRCAGGGDGERAAGVEAEEENARFLP